ncbi:BURP domain-containing protein 9-like [Miscanthus floridulus]|uniref:BURP domain-containing protein 9-like n=1 Tax=Miscanthus floridulus TaxID=154761 RepID=UPI00345A9021
MGVNGAYNTVEGNVGAYNTVRVRVVVEYYTGIRVGCTSSTNFSKSNDKKADFRWDFDAKEDDKKDNHRWDFGTKADDKKADCRWDFDAKQDEKKANRRWDFATNGDDKKADFRWDFDAKEDDKKANHRWDFAVKVDEKMADFRWDFDAKLGDTKANHRWDFATNGDDKKTDFRWDFDAKEGEEKANHRWDFATKGDDKKVGFRWNFDAKQDDKKADHRWDFAIDGDDKKVDFRWDVDAKEDDEKTNHRWDFATKADGKKADFRWDFDAKQEEGKSNHRWDFATKGDNEKANHRWDLNNFPSLHMGRPHKKEVLEHVHGHGQHGTGHSHGHFNFATLLFTEDALTPGTMVSPYIEPSASPVPFLRRDVSDSIALSTSNFSRIMSKFGPMASTLSMAPRDMWSTVRTCEHPHGVEGEQHVCAASIESMVELAASVLGTRDLRAFSSSADVPAEGVASPPGSPPYKVAAVRAVTAPGQPATTMTCHSMEFPYAVFYCHAVNPTRVYEVTLTRIASEDDGAAATSPSTMRALAVCHLDTSRFSPDNAFFVARRLKPGDAAVCHFTGRGGVVWAPATASTTQEVGQVAVAAQ